MSYLLIKHLQILQRDLNAALLDQAVAEKRLEVAKGDEAYYGKRLMKAGIHAGFLQTVIGCYWLNLMNSGISHRQFLKFVKEVERG